MVPCTKSRNALYTVHTTQPITANNMMCRTCICTECCDCSEMSGNDLDDHMWAESADELLSLTAGFSYLSATTVCHCSSTSQTGLQMFRKNKKKTQGKR